MTKFQKQMLTIAAAGALTAVTALPAMAFENEFHGMFAVKTYLGNFDATGLQFNGQDMKEKTKTDNYTDQRTRIAYTAKASDDLKLVTQFEMNTRWGNRGGTVIDGYAIGNNTGGSIDTDSINIETKHAYLDFNIGKSVNAKIGQQAYKDTLKGLYVDADLPMAYVAYKANGYTLGLGYSRFNDAAGAFKGDLASDLYVIDNTYAFNKDTKVAFSYYLNADNAAGATTAKKVNTFGLSGQTKLGSLDLSGFAAMQAGYKNAAGIRTSYHGWAADVLATMAVGSGKARAGFLFTSGNNKTDGHDGGWQTLSSAGASAVQNSYNESGMMLLVRNTSMGGTGTDTYFRKPITNIALAHLGYDANLTEKAYLNGNVGFAWLPASDYILGSKGAATNDLAGANASDFLGTEMNLEAGYKLYKNLTLKAQAAYVVLGSAYKDAAAKANGDRTDPANPWTMRLGAHYSF